MLIEFTDKGVKVGFNEKGKDKAFEELDFANRLRVLHFLPVLTDSLKHEHSKMLEG